MKNLAFTLAAFLFALSTDAQEWTKWQITYESNNEVFTAIDFYDHENGIVVGEGGVIKVTDDAGQTWTEYSNTTFGDILGVDMHKADEIYMFNQHEVYRLSGSSLSSEMIFKNDDVDIKFCEKQIMPIASKVDAPYIYVGGNNNLAYCSQSNGNKWYKVDVRELNGQDDVLFINGFYNEVGEDTVYTVVFSISGACRSFSDMSNYDAQAKFFEGTTVSRINNVNNHNPFYTNEKIVAVDENGQISLVWSTSQEDLSHSKSNSLNDGILVSEMISSLNNKNTWLGWVIGDGGYIAEYSAKLTEGVYEEITTPTSKNLNAINFSSEYNVTDKSKFAYGTVCIAGDGVIMMCYIDWNPSTSVDFVQKEVSTKVYPNPFTGALNISLSHLDINESLGIKVSNIQGQALVEEHYSNVASNSLDLQLGSSLAKGVYFLEITNGSHSQVQKVIKE